MSYQDLKILDFRPAYIHRKISELIMELESDPEKQQILWEEWLEFHENKTNWQKIRRQ